MPAQLSIQGMTRLYLGLVLAATIAAAALVAAPASAAAPARLYLTFVSHNEDSNNALCAPVNATQARYLANRAALLLVAQTIYAGGGAYDMQSDWEWITRTAQWETDEVKRSAVFLCFVAGGDKRGVPKKRSAGD